MRPRIVADASAVMAWALNEPGRAEPARDAIASSSLVVPAIWRLEVANVALVYELRCRLKPDDSARILGEIERLGATLASGAFDLPLVELASLARPHQLTAYDAAYLDVARKEQLPLLTFDNNLQDAARRLGIPLVLDRLAPPA